MTDLEFKPLRQLDFSELAELFNRCFEEYVVPVQVTAEFLATRCRRDRVDHGRSFYGVKGEEKVSLALVAPHFDVARLAGMGVALPARREGVGRATVSEFLARLRTEGFRKAYLEVFEQNERAVRLYSSFGFQPTQRLLGFQRGEVEAGQASPIREAPVNEYLEALREAGDDLPLLHSPESGTTITLPTRCLIVDGAAYLCMGPPNRGPISPIGFVVRRECRGQGKGRELFDAVQAAYSGKGWFLPQIFPEGVGGFLERLGFSRLDLNQFEMTLAL